MRINIWKNNLLKQLIKLNQRKIILAVIIFSILGFIGLNKLFSPVSAAITTDATSFSQQTAGSSMTISHTTTGSNKLMLVGVSLNISNNQTRAVQTVTYNGLNLFLEGSVNNGDVRSEIWSLVNPPSGSFNAVISLNGALCSNCGFIAGVTTLNGVHQSIPFGTFTSNFGTSNSGSVSVTSAIGELIFDTISAESAASLTVGAGQSQLWNTSAGVSGALGFGGASTEPGNSSVNMSWSLGSSNIWAIGAIAIKPAAVPTVTPTNTPVPPTPSKTPTPSITPTPTAFITLTPTRTPTPPVSLSPSPSVILSPTAVITGANLDSVSSIYSYSGLGYYTLDPAFDGNRTANKDVNIFLISGSLEISQNFDLTDSKDSVTFIVNGNILIDGNVTRIPGVYISSQTFSVAQSNNPLIIDGMVYANNFNLNRSYYSLTTPTYQIIYQPKYAIDLLPYLGRSQINWQEIK